MPARSRPWRWRLKVRRIEAVALVNGAISELGVRLSKVSNEWIAYDEEAAAAAGKESIAGIERFQQQMLVANSTAFLLTGLLGFLTFRRIVQADPSAGSVGPGHRRRRLREDRSVCPASTDETGVLARSIDVLKQGAAAMDEQRWVKSNVSRLTGELQGAASLAGVRATAAVGFRSDAGRRHCRFLRV